MNAQNKFGTIEADRQADEKNNQAGPVDRHLTAISRKRLSRPMAWAKKAGIFEGRSIIDYGCGKGYDTATLAAEGYDITGYDPHWAPETKIMDRYDVVACNYVLNVIEDRNERINLLRQLWAMADEALVIAVRTNRESIKKARPYKDGLLTSRNTFQKLFSQEDIQELFREALDMDVRCCALGVVVVCK